MHSAGLFMVNTSETKSTYSSSYPTKEDPEFKITQAQEIFKVILEENSDKLKEAIQATSLESRAMITFHRKIPSGIKLPFRLIDPLQIAALIGSEEKVKILLNYLQKNSIGSFLYSHCIDGFPFKIVEPIFSKADPDVLVDYIERVGKEISKAKSDEHKSFLEGKQIELAGRLTPFFSELSISLSFHLIIGGANGSFSLTEIVLNYLYDTPILDAQKKALQILKK